MVCQHGVVAGDEIVATTAMIKEPLSWSAHVPDVRLLVLLESRGQGIGRALVEGSIERAIAGGATTKLTARMAADQRGAITLFEESGSAERRCCASRFATSRANYKTLRCFR